ncbi:ABC transporter ATP-binding protein [Desulfatitalea alkaliphila]|uniref:ABC transporter ATP-binding protein n=1 Tax=Desulfatitalea alkaliphila TaxID=2929485 RepID=A0AA41R6A1_9BACT|nr:ABC transporter ATP-binding protein [Desulfatitalea alkaliphila]MCJ8501701.1 ABC transporter ATP-binding protein [Desulfatitalea alkaliphila]
MARIDLEEVAHSYAPRTQSLQDYALKRIHITWEDGGAYALLGPSGCGKTTMLNIISGLLVPSQGKVLYDGRDVTAMAPERRNIAQVFQFPVLYDTMTVAENLAFPLRNRGVAPDRIRHRVKEVADMLDLTGVINKKAAGLSADAKQKISLGRGLVRDDVAAILFDEPLTVIDPHLKWQLRRKLKEIHERSRTTMVYVTHDQVEAMTFADTIVVMYEGEVVQVGTPEALYEQPRHKFVGYFIGSPGMNFLACRLEGDTAHVNGAVIPLDSETAEAGRRARGKLELGIRPMHLEVHSRQVSGGVPVAVRLIEDQGDAKIVTTALDGQTVVARIPETHPVPGEKAWLRFPPQWTRLFADERLVG